MTFNDLIVLIMPLAHATVYWQCIQYINTSMAIQKDLLFNEYT